jgi:hypothetical protein
MLCPDALPSVDSGGPNHLAYGVVRTRGGDAPRDHGERTTGARRGVKQ